MLIKFSKNLLNNERIFWKSNKTVLRYFLTAKFPEISQFDLLSKSYEELHKFSIQNNDKFWGTIAETRLQWFKKFNQVKSGNFNDDYFELRWFVDGKLNASGNFNYLINRF
jgi:hypothetical protein